MTVSTSEPMLADLRTGVPDGPRRGPLFEFFRYHGIWAPGVRLFRAVGFRTKAWVIAGTFLVPLAVLAWNYFTSQAAQIDFSAKERTGVVYARALLPVLADAQALRERALAGAGAASAPAAAPLAAAEQALGAALGTAGAYAGWQARTQTATGATGAPQAVFDAHTAAVQSLLDLLGVATDGSNLTLDPDIDTYYLMDATMFRLPAMTEAVAQIRTLAAGGSPTPAQTRRLVEQLALLTSHADAVVAGIGKAAAYNAVLASAVPTAPVGDAVRRLSAHLEQTLLSPGGAHPDAATHVALCTAAAQALGTLSSQGLAQLDGLVAERVSRLESGRNVTAVVLALGLAAAVYLFIAFRKVLDGGLREVAFHIDAMRDGDLTTSPRAWGADEAANLMHTLAQMQQSLCRIVSQVRMASDGMVQASADIAGGAGDLNGRTENAARHLQETASAMEQIAATVSSNAVTMQLATGLAQSNSQAAEQGGQVIGQVVQTMETIQGASHRIGDIVGTIDGIAFQTNLLALNAAVEAARAGEQGRGFAVVAAEVRALAQRSASAAREIRGLITDTVREVEAGVPVVRQAGDAIGAIVAGSQRLRGLLADVEVGSREQSQGVSLSAQAVQELDRATQDNAALVQHTAAAAGALQAQARAMEAEVTRFRLPA